MSNDELILISIVGFALLAGFIAFGKSLFLNSSHISIGTFLFPLFMISFLIIYATSSFSISSNDEVKNVLKDNQTEYEEYEKSFKRDKKLKKLLK